jgi:hypothetical protein
MADQIVELVEAWQVAEGEYHNQLTKHFLMWWGDSPPEGTQAPVPRTLAALAKLKELRFVADMAAERVSDALGDRGSHAEGPESRLTTPAEYIDPDAFA